MTFGSDNSIPKSNKYHHSENRRNFEIRPSAGKSMERAVIDAVVFGSDINRVLRNPLHGRRESLYLDCAVASGIGEREAHHQPDSYPLDILFQKAGNGLVFLWGSECPWNANSKKDQRNVHQMIIWRGCRSALTIIRCTAYGDVGSKPSSDREATVAILPRCEIYYFYFNGLIPDPRSDRPNLPERIKFFRTFLHSARNDRSYVFGRDAETFTPRTNRKTKHLGNSSDRIGHVIAPGHDRERSKRLCYQRNRAFNEYAVPGGVRAGAVLRHGRVVVGDMRLDSAGAARDSEALDIIKTRVTLAAFCTKSVCSA
ncbi:hypothetical protein EVAR_76359_1 [Eumeta japonica]|uniref:Uncharacterized protein n=1 Tax=Eumeta variegata TaxID=151549 RepID=A0A4C1TAR4_EUMVA|nr:hypothetical protein EVAR_76359_1 [Eumeta japonica]